MAEWRCSLVLSVFIVHHSAFPSCTLDRVASWTLYLKDWKARVAATWVGGETICTTFEVTAVTIIRVGATKKYSDGWLSAFGKGKKQSEPAASTKKTAKKSAAKPAKASAKKKSGGKKAKKK